MKITKSKLQKIIQEELGGTLKEGPGRRKYGKGRHYDSFGRKIYKPKKTDVDDDGDTDVEDVLAVAQDAADQEQMQLSLDEGRSGEGSMAQKQLKSIAELANMISQQFDDSTNLEEWVEAKITKAEDYLSSVMNYMRDGSGESEPTSEMNRNEYMWDFLSRSMPDEYEAEENPFRMPDAPGRRSQAHQRRRFYKTKE